MAGAAGIEPAIMVLETMVIPFNYAPIPLQLYKNLLYNARKNQLYMTIVLIIHQYPLCLQYQLFLLYLNQVLLTLLLLVQIQ